MYERAAEESTLEEVIGSIKNPAAKALLASIELDEKKHQMMLNTLLGIKERQDKD